jgi:hypothetical protein
MSEDARVVAETDRQHSETNEGSGRVEHEEGREEAEQDRIDAALGRKEAEGKRVVAEHGRVSAEDLRVQHYADYEDELKKLQDDPEHYMTPGAKRAFQKYRRDNIIAYIVLAAAMAVGVWSFTNNAKQTLKDEINAVVKASCIQSRNPDSTINKFNDLIDIQIQNTRDARTLNLKIGDIERAKLNTKAIIRLQSNRVPVPSVRECEAPLLR